MREGHRDRLRGVSPSREEERELFLSYVRHPSEEMRNSLVVRYLPLARYITKEMAEGLSQSITERGDLMDAAVIGLIKAVENYDAGIGIRFGTYADLLIKGSINDELRTLDPLKRRLRQLSKRSHSLYERLYQKLQRKPTEEEKQEEMSRNGFSERDYATANKLDRLTYQNSQIGDDEETLLMSIGVPNTIEYEASVKEMASIALSKLNERERRIFYLRYWKSLTPTEIGEIEHESDSLIAHAQKRALNKIRTRERFMESLEYLITSGSAA